MEDIREFIGAKTHDANVNHAASISYEGEKILSAIYFLIKNLPPAMQAEFNRNGSLYSESGYDSNLYGIRNACSAVSSELVALVNTFNKIAQEHSAAMQRIEILEKFVLAMLDEEARKRLADYLKTTHRLSNLTIVELIDKINRISH